MKNENEKVMLSEEEENLSKLLKVPAYVITSYSIHYTKLYDTLNQANLVAENVQNNELIISSSDQQSFSISDLEMIFSKWKDQIDFEYGGQKGAPKFPLPVGHQFLLHYYHLTNDEDAKTAVLTSLNKMAFGGIYDQIGGGFARYSTDKLWKVPHFEKMLYDNAQLVSLHCSAFQLTKNQLYKSVVEETLEFVSYNFV